ncbi:MAG: NUDIX hydrolase [Agarilytica sp.]
MSKTKEKIGGWRQKSEDTVYENNWIRVTHDEVLRPNGSEGIYGVVHFKNQAVGVVPIDEDGNTWLVSQSRYTLDQRTWEIPEGGSPVGEDPLETAKRELQEEVGLHAKEWETLMTLHTSNSVTDEVGYIYVAKGLSLGDQHLEDTEDIEVKKLPLIEAIDMAKRGEITDAMSLAALFRLGLSE